MASTTDKVDTYFPNLPSREAIVALCHRQGPLSTELVYPSLEHPIAYIKYGAVTMGEARTQRHIRKYTKDQPGRARIPEIYDFFEIDHRTYIVMEYVVGDTVIERWQKSPEDQAWILDVVAKAITQFMSVPTSGRCSWSGRRWLYPARFLPR